MMLLGKNLSRKTHCYLGKTYEYSRVIFLESDEILAWRWIRFLACLQLKYFSLLSMYTVTIQYFLIRIYCTLLLFQ